MATQVLNDGDGFRWDIIDVYPFTNTVGTAVLDGSDDSFDGGFTLKINGVTFAGSFLRPELAGRQLVLSDSIGSLQVTHKVYVPETSGVGFARFLETVTNTSRAAVTVSFQIQSNSGNDGDFRTAFTSSGDAAFGGDDVWVINSDTPTPNDSDGEAVFHLFGDGSAAPVAVGTMVFDGSTTDGITYTFQTTIAPGETASFLHFGSQQINSNFTLAEISQIQSGGVGSDLTAQALFGLSDAELFQTFNFELQIRYDGTSGDDLIIANTVSDFSGAANLINGLAGNDVIYGNEGNDSLFGNQGDDVIFGGQGDDVAYGGQQNDAVDGNLGNDELYGNLDEDTLSGNQGADFLHGGQGNDIIYGGQDNDVLNGGLGNDILTGGLGSDSFTFATAQGNDIVTDFDFSQGDRLDLQGQSYDLTTAEDGSAALLLDGGGVIILQGVTADEFNMSFVA